MLNTLKKERQQRLVRGVRKIVLIASGKGGVGKSTVAVNVAVALAERGLRIGILDADIYGPSIPIMYGIEAKAKFSDNLIVPAEKYGLKISSVGFLVDQDVAVIWRGPLVTKMLYQLLSMTEWCAPGEKELDFLIVDTPPGTGDVHLSLAENYKIDGALIVSTPQALSIADAHKAVDMFGKLGIPVLGIVENMSYFQGLDSEHKNYLFGQEGVKRYSQERNLTCITQIPIIPQVAESADSGIPLVYRKGLLYQDAGKYFKVIADYIAIQP